MSSRPRAVVVGGGISGLAAAWRLSLLRPETQITVVEAAARFGGKLVTEHRDGFLVEGAADGFLARKPPALAWARELGLEADLIEPSRDHRFSHVLWDGALHRMPEGFSGLVPADPRGLLQTGLLTPEGAVRAAGEGAVALRSEGPEESVEEFFSRRYGREAFDRLMEPLLAGIYAGDARRLSAEAAFPQLTALERRGRSLTEGLADQPKSEGPAFRSFTGGMARFPSALEAVLGSAGVRLIRGRAVTGVDRAGKGFAVLAGGEVIEADAVLLAVPPRAAGPLVRRLSPRTAAVLEGWPVSSVAQLNVAFDEAEVPSLPAGSGFVVPRAAGMPFSAATWSSRKWPGRAPKGGVLVRIYFGGARDPEGWARPEPALLDAALALLGGFQGGRHPRPLWHRMFRWKYAFAQPDLGHAGRHQALADAAVPGLVLAGGYFAGVGIPDCLARAETAAGAVDRFLTTGDIET